MRDLGNTLIVVEHDEDTMYAADWIVDVGPGAGIHGGNIVAEGTVEDIKRNPNSITGQYLSGKKRIEIPDVRRQPKGFLTIRGAKEHNLKNIDVKVPLGCLCCVTGVSGSGKSSLVNEILYKHLAKVLNRAKTRPGAFGSMEGVEQLDKSSALTKAPSGARPGRIRRRTPGCLTRFARSLPPPPKRRRAATRKTASPSTSRAGGAKTAAATGC